ncbi:MAG: DUF1330 domain-containing protein [Pseudomonadota bacterium]
MPAFFIAHVNVNDREAFREYERGVLQTIKPFSGRVLAAAPAKRLDGAEAKNHNVIISFPSVEDAQGWWDSADYQAIIPIRLEHAPGADAMILPGL